MPDRKKPVTQLPEELAAQVKRLIEAVKMVRPSTVRSVDAAMLEIISGTLAARLEQYPTSIEEDEGMIQSAVGRRKMAIEVRLGEKTVLRDVKAFVDMRRKCLAEEEPRLKKQRVS